MAEAFDVKTYEPAGPVLKAFHESSKFVRLMAGPVGSGKTAGAGCVEMSLGAMIQNPMPYDGDDRGIRRAKFGVLRDSYRNLYSQFIPSWHEWYPRELGVFTGSDDRPAMHTIELETPLGPCEIQVEMRALGVNSVEKTCRGWNLTGCFLDEADLLPEDTIGYLTGRVKRWPPKPYRVSKGVWGVFNKPNEDHWLYRVCVEAPPATYGFFDQPAGLLEDGRPNPAAENFARLDDDYYEVQVASNTHLPGYRERMVMNRWGSALGGAVIYGSFNRAVHVAQTELQPYPGQQLWIGLDGGGTPAAAICGRDRHGRIVVYAEVVLVDPNDPHQKRLMRQVGGKRFGRALADTLRGRFPNCRVQLAWGDPSAWFGIDREDGELGLLEVAAQVAEIPITPAETNAVDWRHEAVRQPMEDLSFGGGLPGLLINPSCKFLIRGFTSDYRWQPTEKKQEGETLKAQKTATSHVHDALQYVCLGMIGKAALMSGKKFDRWQPSAGGVLTPSVSQNSDSTGARLLAQTGGRATVKGTHYHVDFNPWRS